MLDAACGIGYGSKMLADAGNTVIGVDIDEGAITAAKKYYAGPTYIRVNIMAADIGYPLVDAVTSFETLEHLSDPGRALLNFYLSLDPGGMLICSVPNQDRYPFKTETFAGDTYPHLRHYTPADFAELLLENGFDVQQRYSQDNKLSDVATGTDGMFLVYVCKRRFRS